MKNSNDDWRGHQKHKCDDTSEAQVKGSNIFHSVFRFFTLLQFSDFVAVGFAASIDSNIEFVGVGVVVVVVVDAIFVDIRFAVDNVELCGLWFFDVDNGVIFVAEFRGACSFEEFGNVVTVADVECFEVGFVDVVKFGSFIAVVDLEFFKVWFAVEEFGNVVAAADVKSFEVRVVDIVEYILLYCFRMDLRCLRIVMYTNIFNKNSIGTAVKNTKTNDPFRYSYFLPVSLAIKASAK